MPNSYNKKKMQGRKSVNARYAILIVITSIIYVIMPTAMAQNAERGELLYWNHCSSCHDKSVHTHKDRRADSKEEVYIWVLAWAIHNGLDWREEEVDDVASYLSRYLYKFDE